MRRKTVVNLKRLRLPLGAKKFRIAPDNDLVPVFEDEPEDVQPAPPTTAEEKVTNPASSPRCSIV